MKDFTGPDASSPWRFSFMALSRIQGSAWLGEIKSASSPFTRAGEPPWIKVRAVCSVPARASIPELSHGEDSEVPPRFGEGQRCLVALWLAGSTVSHIGDVTR